MWPTLFNIPYLNMPVRGYGLMLMIAFLGGTWWATRRAMRVKADPDLVVNLGFIALLFSVIGARTFYVVHYWERFAGQGLWKILDVTAGGLEFYGGFIGAFVAGVAYLLMKRASVRLYADILAPSLMFGMGAARIGCFLNGCCWGGPCPATLPWAVRFPYASAAQYRQWEERMMTLPAELIVLHTSGIAYPLSREVVGTSRPERDSLLQTWQEAKDRLEAAEMQHADEETRARLQQELQQAVTAIGQHKAQLDPLTIQSVKFGVSPEAIDVRASQPEYQSVHVHPVQLYASINGFVLAVLLNAVFHRRRRHGMVFGLLLLLYPFCRIVEEIVRIDNPHDMAGLTASQFVSVVLLVSGVLWLWAIGRMPLRSPRAVPWVPPAEPEPSRAASPSPKKRK
ncbi:MAG: hypothetical protein GXY55_03150 [Phycisphaerae bacterium]|nr:hypothetical protein [Phycisphaerae bacterium]